jgi:hypothetical protein
LDFDRFRSWALNGAFEAAVAGDDRRGRGPSLVPLLTGHDAVSSALRPRGRAAPSVALSQVTVVPAGVRMVDGVGIAVGFRYITSKVSS